MDKELADHLERVRAARGELTESIRALEDALALPAGLGDTWRRRVRAALTELAHDLRDHVEITEADGGLHADLLANAPRLALPVDALVADHRYFIEEVERLLAERDSGQARENADAHREAVGAMLTRLTRHRQRGSDLIYEAYEVDIGGSG